MVERPRTKTVIAVKILGVKVIGANISYFEREASDESASVGM